VVRAINNSGATAKCRGGTLSYSAHRREPVCITAELPFGTGIKEFVLVRLGAVEFMAIKPETLEMARLYKSGLTLEEIGNRYGISRQRVQQRFKEAGLT
jgi:hypothetical protein